ncbi:similar to Saccharomyces cerevisiae YAR008W SEN34 Subunit of the tRNA splicing endonuclease, which is composed of Sen2p, Sen15p, Sen34p, and Sen54p [Maudiozyma saulgeensis]|uniref:tRNA-splicing endonuclease subunit Sen34 n=1 Tax=Maudiozyma saulgeensis TaxID=1789683 RepID=A0A1X7RAF2_9SACH|nr:similar to Saccharomyces cerevisiae YAR008W SEN34 Subunit of the tRNA splicing endonuclease, which is composed of Sen2p, Sen15p, Sen34p, and Sen54p [Kazachstania saulgeensis]
MPVTINLICGAQEDGQTILSPLIFNIDDIKKLRDVGICGILSGTLPSAAQQNIFLSVPLKLMIEEAIWLYLNGLAEFKVLRGDTAHLVKEILDRDAHNIHVVAKERLERSFELQREYKREQHRLKLERLGIISPETSNKNTSDQSQNDKLLEASLFIETPTTSNLLNNLHLNHENGINDNLLHILVSQYSNWDNFLLFQALKDKGYVLAPGGRFGGKFIAYPGDPLRYHSHMVVRDALHYKDQPLDLLELAANARLGTAVKKIWVIGAPIPTNDKLESNNIPSKKDVSFYSVEWAGFG